MFKKLKGHLIIALAIIVFVEVVFYSLSQILFWSVYKAGGGLSILALFIIIYPATIAVGWFFAHFMVKGRTYLKEKQLTTLLVVLLVPTFATTELGIRGISDISSELSQQLKIVPFVLISSVIILNLYSGMAKKKTAHWLIVGGAFVICFGGTVVTSIASSNRASLTEAQSLPFTVYIPSALPTGFTLWNYANSISYDKPEDAEIRLEYVNRTGISTGTVGAEVIHVIDVMQTSKENLGIVACDEPKSQTSTCWEGFGYVYDYPMYTKVFQGKRKVFIELDGTSILIDVRNSSSPENKSGGIDDAELVEFIKSFKQANPKQLVEHTRNK
jgi:hypothetical protein